MIYKNEDGSIYKIGDIDENFMLFQKIGNEKITDNEIEAIATEIGSVEKSIKEIVEVLNYLLNKAKRERAIKPVKPSKNPGTSIKKGFDAGMPDPQKANQEPDVDMSNEIKKGD